LELPDDPDDPEEPEAPAADPLAAPPSPPALLRGSVAAFFLLVCFAVVLASGAVLALVSVEALIEELLLGVVLLVVLGVVELDVPLYVDCGVWLVLELWIAELLMPLVLLLGVLDEVVVDVRGAALFLPWSPSANAEPLANATSVVTRNIGASLRI
jgi:hypothetical protein